MVHASEPTNEWAAASALTISLIRPKALEMSAPSSMLNNPAVIGPAPSGIGIRRLCSIEMIAALSVSQYAYAPSASAIHLSSIDKSSRPPAVIREPMWGASQSPGSSTTFDVVSNDSSPENTLSGSLSDSFGLSSTKRPYGPLLAS